jgi:hypothetical protein
MSDATNWWLVGNLSQDTNSTTPASPGTTWQDTDTSATANPYQAQMESRALGLAKAKGWTMDHAMAVVNGQVAFLKANPNASSADILAHIQQQYVNSPAYLNAHFPGLLEHRKAGLGNITPAQYQATVQSYKNLARQYGLPKGFYDQPKDFANWIAKGVSPQELANRMQSATDLVRSHNPEQLAAFKNYYGIEPKNLVAYVLDPKRALPVLQQQIQVAAVGGEALAQSLDVSKQLSETLVGKGVSQQQARAGFSDVSASQDTVQELAGIDNTSIDTTGIVNAEFKLNAGDQAKVAGLASQERARFGGASGNGTQILGTNMSGSI